MDKDPTSKRGDGRSPAAKRLQVEAIWRVIRQLGEGGNLALAELTPKKALEMFTLLRKELKIRSDKELEFLKASLQKSKNGDQKLGDVSPFLAEFDGDSGDGQQIVIPGQHLTRPNAASEDEFETLVSVDPLLRMMMSVRKPCRLKMRSSHGKELWWLVKGGEDLRQDERVQQVLRTMNFALQNERQCAQRRLVVHTFAVVPASARVGLVEWVQDTRPLAELLDESLKNANVGILSHRQPASEMNKKVRTSSPSDSLGHEYSKRLGLDSLDPKHAGKHVGKHVDVPRLLVGYAESVKQLPPDLLRLALMRKSQTARMEFELRDHYSQTLATMNVCHYILGIGDRHTSNTLVASNGALIGIDFGHAFGVATQLVPIPELMPFRLTPQTLGVLAPLDAHSLLKRTMTFVMAALRKNRELLKQTMRIFIDDPTLDWKQFAQKNEQTESGQTVEEDLETFTSMKWEGVCQKLDGVHPTDVMLAEIKTQQNVWIRTSVVVQELVQGKHDPRSDRFGKWQAWKEGSAPFLPESVQVEALVAHATDPAVLAHTWGGWSPWA